MNEISSNSNTILYYSDASSEENGYGTFLKSLDSTFITANSLDHFYSEYKSRNDILFALMDIQNTSKLMPPHSKHRNDTLVRPPLFIILSPMTTISETYPIREWADDIILGEATPEKLKSMIYFWTKLSPTCSKDALKKLIGTTKNNDLVKNILNSYVESLKKVYDKSVQAALHDDLTEIAKACHSIKASAKMLGAENLFHICQWIELKKNMKLPLSDRFKTYLLTRLSENLEFYRQLSRTPLDELE